MLRLAIISTIAAATAYTPLAAATPKRATVTHLAPSAAPAGKQIRLVAVVDNAWTEQALLVRYRRHASAGAFHNAAFERSSAGGYYAVIPAGDVQRPGVEYYISGKATGGSEVLHFASAAAPHVVNVQPTLLTRRQEAELDRLAGFRSSVTARLIGHNFNNRDPARQDYFLRGELEWTHRLLRQVHSITLGYGLIEGVTPSTSEAFDRKTGARYGYGGARFRLHDSASIDARAYLGVDRDEFIVGIRGELTFGQPHRSSVNVGGEVLENQGSSVWVRLQWDTVQPFLMGAAIVKTDLPGAELDDGSYIVYDITYNMTERLSLRGNVSFGSRDGPGNFGGGLATSLAF